MSWKKSLLAICKVLGLFVNTLTVHDTNSLHSIDNLMQLIQWQLPKKQRTFSQFFLAFSGFRLNFEHSEKKDPHSLCISDITDQEGRKVSKDTSTSDMVNRPKHY